MTSVFMAYTTKWWPYIYCFEKHKKRLDIGEMTSWALDISNMGV